MDEAESGSELSQLEAFIASTRDELEIVRTEVREIGLLVQQSQGEVNKLAERNASINANIHQLQAHFDSVPREDIRSTYEAFQDAQQRLFTMRGQLEKLQSDEGHLSRFEKFMLETLELLEGRPVLNVTDQEIEVDSVLQQIIEAQEDVRRTISRQIHDGPAQALSNFILQTEIAVRLFSTDQEKAREELDNLKASATSTFAQVRDFIFDLRPMMLDDLGLTPTLRRYKEAYQEKTGIDVNLVTTGSESRLAPHIEALAFRTVQSILKNARDHAQATNVKIMLDSDAKILRISVQDNGKGFDIETATDDDVMKLGLQTFRDRIVSMGGAFQYESTIDEGTKFLFSMPVSE
jgi:two-component system sensor histidine kinase DegS